MAKALPSSDREISCAVAGCLEIRCKMRAGDEIVLRCDETHVYAALHAYERGRIAFEANKVPPFGLMDLASLNARRPHVSL